MTTIMRHGGEGHVMRPDGVYRTSVLQPMVGYSPQTDVMAVAQSFTQGPPLAMMLSGLRGPTFFDRVKAKFAEMRARARGFSFAVPGQAAVSREASQASPQIQSQMDLLARLTRLPNPTQAGSMLIRRRFNTYYRAG